MSEPAARQTLYVSWGGTGRSASLRGAFRQAIENGGSLIYLAVLDDSTFADIDEDLLLVAADELEWMLDAQINLTRTQTGADDLAVRVAVRRGDVLAQIGAVVETLGDTEILIGAPVPTGGHETIDSLVAAVAARTGQPTSLVEPD